MVPPRSIGSRTAMPLQIGDVWLIMLESRTATSVRLAARYLIRAKAEPDPGRIVDLPRCCASVDLQPT